MKVSEFNICGLYEFVPHPQHVSHQQPKRGKNRVVTVLVLLCILFHRFTMKIQSVESIL